MEVCVKTYVESLSGERNIINKAYVTLVALDENDNPVPVPAVQPATDPEAEEWRAGARRRELRKTRRTEKY